MWCRYCHSYWMLKTNYETVTKIFSLLATLSITCSSEDKIPEVSWHFMGTAGKRKLSRVSSKEFSHSWKETTAKGLISFTCLGCNRMMLDPRGPTTSKSWRSLTPLGLFVLFIKAFIYRVGGGETYFTSLHLQNWSMEGENKPWHLFIEENIFETDNILDAFSFFLLKVTQRKCENCGNGIT